MENEIVCPVYYPSWVFEMTWALIKVPLLNQSTHSQPTDSNPSGSILGERVEVTQIVKVMVGDLLPALTKRELLSAEDAVCCICLVKYQNNEELCELPCSHLFHKGCVNKWLKINALCPLCKSEVGNAASSTISSGNDRNRRTAGSSI